MWNVSVFLISTLVFRNFVANMLLQIFFFVLSSSFRNSCPLWFIIVIGFVFPNFFFLSYMFISWHTTSHSCSLKCIINSWIPTLISYHYFQEMIRLMRWYIFFQCNVNKWKLNIFIKITAKEYDALTDLNLVHNIINYKEFFLSISGW